MERATESRSLRAPAGDGQTLVEPPLARLPAVVERNRQRLAKFEYDVQGRSLSELAASARRSLLKHAVGYTIRYRDVPSVWRDAKNLATAPFLLSGHQPQLFHPGVWYKNFVLGSLAQQMSGVGIHLLIDSDLCRSVSIRVPTGSVERPQLEAVAYDEPDFEVPYEERSIRDYGTFASFGQRVSEVFGPLVREPLVDALWPATLSSDPAERNLGLRLAHGRHALEATWNSQTLELPQSSVCQLPEFAWFTAHVLAHLPRFWSAYNDALGEYRRAHRQRSRAHPVPNLAEEHGWLEAPFWIWSSEDPRRRPLFARQSGEELHITDRIHLTAELTLSADRDAHTAVEQLLELGERGIKIRTRALTTTLFARLVLSDLFLHGIGGAKYDHVTDRIAESFFGLALPEYAAVSATLRLPIARNTGGINGPSCAVQLRELQYHPERFVSENGIDHDDASRAREIVATKQRWIETPKSPDNARRRHLGIVAANEALQPFVAGRREQIERQCAEQRQTSRALDILQSRDYAFCLYARQQIDHLLDGLVLRP